MSSVSGTRGAEFQLAGSGSLGFGVAAGAAMGVGRSGLAEPLGGWDPCGVELAVDELAVDELVVEAPIGWRRARVNSARFSFMPSPRGTVFMRRRPSIKSRWPT